MDSSDTVDAEQALGATCVPGVRGLGVQIRSAGAVVQVPDALPLTVSDRLLLAAWVHPNRVDGDRPIVIKRLRDQTSFSLGIHRGNIEMLVVLTNGTTVISRAPISPGAWTHVAGRYDGTFLFLFINGKQVGQVVAAGTIRNLPVPLRIGATSQKQHFDGIIDEVLVSTEDISPELAELACVPRPATMVVSPATSGPVPFDTRFHYDILVTNNDLGSCAPRPFRVSADSFEQFVSTTVNPPPEGNITPPGATVDFGLLVSGTEEAGVGQRHLPLQLFDGQAILDSGLDVVFELRPPDCFVFNNTELMIIHPSVVDDPLRTAGGDGDGDAGGDGGAWTFGHLLREMAPRAEDGPALALALFQHWLQDVTVNGFTVAARPAAQQQILDVWPKAASGELDLDQAPFRLLAIVNRIDLRDLGAGSAGQGRFVFALNRGGGIIPEDFTVILEYNLPATTEQEVLDWASRWHQLSAHPFPSEEYNAALQALTRRFTDRVEDPSRANGSNLLQLRTNDFALSSFTRWELREFELSKDTGFFAETTVKETPDTSFNQTPVLAAFVNENATAIKAVIPGAASRTIPETLAGSSFLAGSVFNDSSFIWSAPGIEDPEARAHLALNTCNGCHGSGTNTRFLMIVPRLPGRAASLSPFLTGTTAFDPVTGENRVFNDLARRKASMNALVCPQAAGSVP